MVCTDCHFTPFKNWLKHIFVLTASVWDWEAAPCSTLPTADEKAVTEFAVTTMSSSLFQSATVLMKNEFLYCSVLLSGILKPQEFWISCLGMVQTPSTGLWHPSVPESDDWSVGMVLSESQSLQVAGRILLLFLSAGIGKLSGGMAGMWPFTVL